MKREPQLWPRPGDSIHEHYLIIHFYFSLLSDAYLLSVLTMAIIRIYRSQREPGWVGEGLLGKRSFELGFA